MRNMKSIVVAAIIGLLATSIIPATAAHAAGSTAATVLSQLRVSDAVNTGYDRDLFNHWTDDNKNGCDTRREVLIAESTTPVAGAAQCDLSGGSWLSYYDGATWTDPSDVDIDHMVPLSEAWKSGAHGWSAEQRQAFANDLSFPSSLVAVTDNVNQSKGDRDPAAWLPPLAEVYCQYATEWVLVKYRWQLAVDPAEKAALTNLLSGSCGSTDVELPAVVGPAVDHTPGNNPGNPSGGNVNAPIGTGAVSVKGPSSELLPGTTVEIRKDSCTGPAVWRTTTSSQPQAYGAFGIGLAAGQYCVKTLSVPASYSLPADVVFTMAARAANWVTVWVPGPLKKVPVNGALVAKNANGTPVNGVRALIREGACASNGPGVWRSTTAANRWAQGGFGITLTPGKHCVTTQAVPAGYQTPAPFEVNVTSPSPYWLTVWLPGPVPKSTVTGAVVAKNSKGAPINWVRASIAEGSCANPGRGVWRSTTSGNQWAQGGFGISLLEGTHCVTTEEVPDGYDIPAPFTVNIAAPSPQWVTIWVPGPGPWVPPTPVAPPVAPPTSADYKNCAAVRAAGAAPIYAGQPGYGSHLDRDGDGVGCE